MSQTLSTLFSLLLCAGALGVIACSIWEDQMAFRTAIRGGRIGPVALPPHTHRVASPRAARMIRLDVAPVARPRRAAA
jgi:hypothetical protein